MRYEERRPHNDAGQISLGGLREVARQAAENPQLPANGAAFITPQGSIVQAPDDSGAIANITQTFRSSTIDYFGSTVIIDAASSLLINPGGTLTYAGGAVGYSSSTTETLSPNVTLTVTGPGGTVYQVGAGGMTFVQPATFTGPATFDDYLLLPIVQPPAAGQQLGSTYLSGTTLQTWSGSSWVDVGANAVQLAGLAVSNAAPTNGQVIAWNGSAWAPTTAATSALTTYSGTTTASYVTVFDQSNAAGLAGGFTLYNLDGANAINARITWTDFAGNSSTTVYGVAHGTTQTVDLGALIPGGGTAYPPFREIKLEVEDNVGGSHAAYQVELLLISGAAAAGTGTVTSVALAAPSEFSVSGSPVTTAGTLTLAWANPVSVAHGGTGQASLTVGNVLVGNGTSAVTLAAPGSGGNFLVSQGASSAPLFVAMGGDATVTSAGTVTVAKINGVALGTTTATSGNLLIADGTDWDSVAMSGGATISSAGVVTLTTFVAAGGSHAAGAVPDPGSTAHTNQPYYLGDGATFLAPHGLPLGASFVSTAETTTSTSFVDLATAQSITFTLDSSQTVNVLAVAATQNSTGSAIDSIGISVDGTVTASSAVTCNSANAPYPLVCLYSGSLGSGSHTIKLRFDVNAGTGTFSNRGMVIWMG